MKKTIARGRDGSLVKGLLRFSNKLKYGKVSSKTKAIYIANNETKALVRPRLRP